MLFLFLVCTKQTRHHFFFFRMTGDSSDHLGQDCSDGSDQSWCETFVVEKSSSDLEGSASYQYKRSELMSVHDAADQSFTFIFGRFDVLGPASGSVSYVYLNNEKFGPISIDNSWWLVHCYSRCDCMVRQGIAGRQGIPDLPQTGPY